jgi:hypothetical protein
MPGGKSIASHEDRIAINSSSNDNDNQKSLGADQKEAPEAHASTHNCCLIECDVVMSRGVLSQRDPFTHKYKA